VIVVGGDGVQGARKSGADAAADADAATDLNAAAEMTADAAAPRQRIVRVGTSRRAKLTPAPNTTAEPTHAEAMGEEPPPVPKGASGPNDVQLRQDVPPHY